MKTTILLSALTLGMLTLVPAYGQRDKNKRGERESESYTPAAIVFRDRGAGTIEANVKARPADGTVVAVKVYRKDRQFSKRIVDEVNVPACGEKLEPGRVCMRSTSDGVKLIYDLAPAEPETATYELAYFLTDPRKGDVAQILKVEEPFDKEDPDVQVLYSSEKKTEFRTEITTHPNGEIVVNVRSASGDLSPESREFIVQRFRRLYDWLEPKTVTPEGIAKVYVEPTTRLIKEGKTREETLKNLEYKVVGVRLSPTGARGAADRGTFSVVLVTDRVFPPGKYDLSVEFAPDAPPELKGELVNSLTGATIKQADASNAGSDRVFGLRDLRNNLDLALAFTSSVDNVKVGTKTVRQRSTVGVFDVRFAPLLNWHRDGDTRNFFTPLFIDAKVSNGAIDKKSVSSNRIFVGSQFVRRIVDLKRKNKYVFSFTAANVSDRDFQRAEAKFTFDFRPVFNALNHLLSNDYKSPAPDSILIPSNGPKFIPCCKFGWLIQPIVGVDLGHVYRTKRSAFDVEDTNHGVERLFVGVDTLFNITKYANIRLYDMLYIRGEAPTHRMRNYFKGEIQAPLFTSGDTSQCLFLSFEKGDLPPFSTPTVNSLRIGYRITSDFFKQRP